MNLLEPSCLESHDGAEGSVHALIRLDRYVSCAT
jgi:hypothetical protein